MEKPQQTLIDILEDQMWIWIIINAAKNLHVSNSKVKDSLLKDEAETCFMTGCYFSTEAEPHWMLFEGTCTQTFENKLVGDRWPRTVLTCMISSCVSNEERWMVRPSSKIVPGLLLWVCCLTWFLLLSLSPALLSSPSSSFSSIKRQCGFRFSGNIVCLPYSYCWKHPALFYIRLLCTPSLKGGILE